MERSDTTRMSEIGMSENDKSEIGQSETDKLAAKVKALEKEKSEKEQAEKDLAEKKKKRKKRTLIIAASIALAVIIGLLVYFFWLRPESDILDMGIPRATLPNGGIITPENLEEERERLGTVSPDAQYTVSMSRQWRFESALTPSSSVYFINVASNSRTVFFDVVLIDTGEIVYSSPYIPLGLEHSNFALDKDLGAGTYDVTIAIFLVDDDHEIVADLSVSTKLIIEN